ncbi:hypothetical protein GCK72_019327 [Caenorhabditis remanei]|uniref:Fibronectin type-III domain-containing protein n=1 Tax=Caenorhabditis remanei TaxID=31234 RepID=A0A6A5GE69_CAERE|nr:hypothetical protein GCK72_019327 [Caenorhabditis remanei]KAF1752772.1 hypothetical protein GCK72_019327 [Caenorhabditis remanei]
MSEEEDNLKSERNENAEEDKENLDDSRVNSSMTNSTLMTTGRVDNEKAEVDENGTLDLSNLSLTHLERNFSEEYAKVKNLIINGNSIQKFTYMKLFPKCEILDAQDCQMNSFVADYNNNLLELYLAKNQLKELNQLGRFHNLKILDLSSNLIDNCQLLFSFNNLEVLNLSNNSLNQLPDLLKCTSLHTLSLADNMISNLTTIADLICPTNLRKFNISSNSIADLSQFSVLSVYKNLEELSVAENPCINEVCEEETFDYRSYIVSCCTEQLHTIDNEKIEDQVQTEGEWLALQGGMKKIGPGNHLILCELIASHFPKADSGPPTPAQKTCHKALEKRRSYAAELLETPGKERILPSDSSMRSEDTDRTVNSIYSPFREWNGKIGTMRTPGSSGRSGLKNKTNLRMCSPPGSKKNKSFTFPNKSSPSNFMENESLRHHETTRTNSTETIICSARTELSFTVDGRSESTPLPIIDSTPTKESSPSTSEANRLTPSVADVSYVCDDSEDMKNRIKSLELKVTELQKQNENLTAINDGLVDTLEAFKSEQNKMWNAIRKQLIPTPQNMTNSFVCETEDGHHVHQVKWDMPLVKGYRIYVDGSPCGQIIGKNNSARITDLSANESHVVQIQPVGVNGEYGDLSKKLHINPQK